MTARIVVVTGTDTEVGKTVTTAALAAVAQQAGLSVAVHKPTQTGVHAGEPGDVAEVARLSGVRTTREGVRLDAPMAPVQAARREGIVLPGLHCHLNGIGGLADAHDLVLVEGAGGLLVQLTDAGDTIADLAGALLAEDFPTTVVVVTRSRLGTLNHTELTLEALRARHLPVGGLIIGSWPDTPDPIDLDNRDHLGQLRVSLLGAVPANAARLAPGDFCSRAPEWIRLPLPPPAVRA